MASPSYRYVEGRNIIVIGKMGCGKTTIINKIVGKDILLAKFSFSRVTRQIDQITGKLELENATYDINFIDTIGMDDAAGSPTSDNNFTNPHIIASIKKALKERFKNGLNLAIVTLNLQSYTRTDIDMFEMIQSNFTPMFWKIAVLVFTHCDGMVESAVQQRINSFKNDCLTKEIAAKFEDRIITVGFPSVKDFKEELKPILERDMERDVKKLHDHIMKANLLQPYEEIIFVPSKSCRTM